MDFDTINALADVPLQPQSPPLAATDRRFCFDSAVTLRIKQNPFTRNVKVTNITTNDEIMRFKHQSSILGDIINLEDTNQKQQLLTIERFGFTGADYDIHEGVSKPQSKRTPCLFTIAASTTETTLTFMNPSTGSSYCGVVEGGIRDRVAILTVREAGNEHAPWRPVARINRPTTVPFANESVEVAAGVDTALVIAFWIARWIEYERSEGQGAIRSKSLIGAASGAVRVAY